MIYIKMALLVFGIIALLTGTTENNLSLNFIASLFIGMYYIITGAEEYKNKGVKGFTVFYFISGIIIAGLGAYIFLTK